MKLNVGSANKRIRGYLNIDGNDEPNVDAICVLDEVPYVFTVKDKAVWGDTILDYRIPDEGSFVFRDYAFDEVLAVEFLEHISFHKTNKVLEEWYRILAPDGTIRIQVPDCGKAMEYYVRGEICDCVPHKSKTGNSEGDFKADPLCFACQGKGKIHPNRWLYSFTGAQKHKYDAHLNIFTKERMREALQAVGFKEVQFEDDLYKLKVTARKRPE